MYIGKSKQEVPQLGRDEYPISKSRRGALWSRVRAIRSGKRDDTALFPISKKKGYVIMKYYDSYFEKTEL